VHPKFEESKVASDRRKPSAIPTSAEVNAGEATPIGRGPLLSESLLYGLDLHPKYLHGDISGVIRHQWLGNSPAINLLRIDPSKRRA
jgi:hypothetical protein